MTDFFAKIFSADFMPHGHCYFWRPEILWLHVISDSFIVFSYYSIPLALVYLVRKRQDLAFNWMFALFAAFIFLCGTTHLLNIFMVWTPMYRLEGIVKLLTGLTSLTTAVLLWLLLPKALALPSVNQLKGEIQDRLRMEEELQLAHFELEARVEARTAELARSNEALREKSQKLERFHSITVNRELQMVKLKREVNELLKELNRPIRYQWADGESASPEMTEQ